MARAKKASELESEFQGDLIKELYSLFPGCLVLKNDSGYMQGIPDLTIFYKKYWAVLEVKPYETAVHQPNQDYYVDMLDNMSYSAFIYPENKEAIINDLQQTFRGRRPSRVPKR